jgi:RimJ/RimL family protein N-acetyltransferase
VSEQALSADGHGPQWAAAVADLADKAGAAFGGSVVQGCISVVDLEPWRLLDAWWLRRCLEPLARLSGRPVRYVPCIGPGAMPRGQRMQAVAPAWSVGTAPVDLNWLIHNNRPLCTATGKAWEPDGAVLLLAGDLAKRLPQQLLLSHHGQMHEWGGVPGDRKWQPIGPERHCEWMAESLHAYVKGLPSSMLSLPIGYWEFLEQAMAWTSHGCLVLARAEGWSSLADIREDAVTRPPVSAESPPVNFHWLARQAPRIGASAHAVLTCRGDAAQVVAGGLPDAERMLPLLCGPLSAAARSARTGRARAVRVLADSGDLEAALSLLQASADDPALLRAAWDALAGAAASAGPVPCAQLGAWLERVMTDNPWIGDDSALLRAAGHLALACGRLDLAQTALRALDESSGTLPADLAALARCLEQLGRLQPALTACDSALLREPGHKDALATRQRVTSRMAAMATPWQIQHKPAESALMLDPLHADHAPLLVRQMRDPSIPIMTALPMLTEGDDGRAWIRTRHEEGPGSYAIVHRQFGFVGFLQLRLWKSTAFVCYWIGVDYQGLGFCGPALALGCDLAAGNGIELLLSCAYDDNDRSIRVLRNGGFITMNVRAQAPDNTRTFVMRPVVPMDPDEARRRLIDFCDNTGSGLRFAAAATAPSETSSTAAGSAGAI